MSNLYTMSGATNERIFFCTSDGAHKFWRVAVEGETQTVRWGRIGTAGQSLTRTFAEYNEAQTATNALIVQKVAKGYEEVSREEADAATGIPAARPRKSDEAEGTEFQLLLPFDEEPRSPILASPPAAPAVVPVAPLSLFD